MKVDDIPVIGKINKTLSKVIANLVILAIICVSLALSILLYPPALAFLASLLLMVAAFSLINIAYNLNVYKKKYLHFFKFLE
jgi:hypothetical protein